MGQAASSSAPTAPIPCPYNSNNCYRISKDERPWVDAIRSESYLDWKKNYEKNDKAGLLRQALKHQDLPCQITHNLYLGDAGSIQNMEKLRARGIVAVLNMAGKSAAPPARILRAFGKYGIEYKSIRAEDREGYPLLERHFEEACEFIQQQSRRGSVVVNCVQGINRSVLIVAAYHLVSVQAEEPCDSCISNNVLETMRHIRNERGNSALSNWSFQEQLVAFAKERNQLGPHPKMAAAIRSTRR